MMHHHQNHQSVSSRQSTVMMKKQQQRQHQNDTHSVPRSVSTDDDEDDDVEKENFASVNTRNPAAVKKSNNSMAVVENYLRRYEHMVHQQEMEEKAVMAHIIPCIQRLMELIYNTTTTTTGSDMMKNDRDSHTGHTMLYKQQFPIQLHHEISYHQLHQAYQQLMRMKETTATTNISNDLTITAMECMTTDRQLMMMLRTLTEKWNVDFSHISMEEETSSLSITWAELIQCYKICIYSMMTMQHLPKGSMARVRARERSLSMMALFEPAPVISSSTGFTDLYVKHMDQNALRPTESKLIHENLVSTANVTEAAASLSTTGLRRRPWLKKRTKRLLPYVAMIALLVFMYGCWHYRYAVTEDRPTDDHTQDGKMMFQRGTNNDQYHHGAVLVPSFPSKSMVALPPSAMLSSQVSGLIPDGSHHPSTIRRQVVQTLHQSDVTRHGHHNIMHAADNHTFTMDIVHQVAAPVRYHPLLGIWSNFHQ